MGMAVAVMMVVMGPHGFELGRSGTTVGGFAADGFELDGGVGDVELVAEGVVDAFENGAAV